MMIGMKVVRRSCLGLGVDGFRAWGIGFGAYLIRVAVTLKPKNFAGAFADLGRRSLTSNPELQQNFRLYLDPKSM